jgi:glycosyltransferase involved in cell wall biosynthesis
MPKISVILPVFNGGKFIAEAVQSILDQTFKDFELIIINDASTDNTLDIVSSFNDSRINIINNAENLRVVKSLNKGLKIATGEFIARMDGDDIAHPLRFEKQLAYMAQHSDVDVCATQVKVFGSQNYVTRQYEQHEFVKASLLFLNNIIHPSVMFRRSAFAQNDLSYDESYDNAEDYALWVKIINQHTFAILPDVLLQYRIHNSNVSVQKADNWDVLQRVNFRIYKQMLVNIGLYPTVAELENHIQIGFGNARSENFTAYVMWLENLIEANKKTHYFDEEALKRIVLHYIIQLTITLQLKISDYKTLLSIISRSFGFSYLLYFPMQRIGNLLKSKLKRI